MTAPDQRHISVLGREAVEWLKPCDGGIFVDATFGAGGYSRAVRILTECVRDASPDPNARAGR